jgi:hypothetical protein
MSRDDGLGGGYVGLVPSAVRWLSSVVADASLDASELSVLFAQLLAHPGLPDVRSTGPQRLAQLSSDMQEASRILLIKADVIDDFTISDVLRDILDNQADYAAREFVGVLDSRDVGNGSPHARGVMGPALPPPVGADAARLIAASFSQIDLDGDGNLSKDEIADASMDPLLPQQLRLAARYLVDNPVFALNLASAASPFSASSNGEGTLVAPTIGTKWPKITEASLNAAIAQITPLQQLGMKSVFDVLDGAKDGEVDGRMSWKDVARVVDHPDDYTAEAVAAAQYLANNRPFFDRLDVARRDAMDGDGIGRHSRDGYVSYEDVLALAINQQVYVNSPVLAANFVRQLPATWQDVTGKSRGLDIRLSSDEAVRALAAAAISASSTLTDQVIVVSMLPESRGAERNRLISYYYSILAQRMNERLNPNVTDQLDPSSVGHSGGNWMMLGPWASNSVGPAISADITALGFNHPTWTDRQYGADGNQWIFGDVAIRYAEFLDAFPVGKPVTATSVSDFFVSMPHPIQSDTSRRLRHHASSHSAEPNRLDRVVR